MRRAGFYHAVVGGELILRMQSFATDGVSWTCESPNVKQQFLPKACLGVDIGR